MHRHPRLIAINLSGGNFAFTLPDGTTRENPGKAGDVNVMTGESHLPPEWRLTIGGHPGGAEVGVADHPLATTLG